MAKAGYYSGDPQLVLEAPVDMVMTVLNYESFEADLELAYSKIAEEENV